MAPLEPFTGPAQNLPAVKGAKFQGVPPHLAAQQGKHVWSEGCAHLRDQWPSGATPLILFSGKEGPPTVPYKEPFCINLAQDHLVNLAVRMRCGTGDRSGGGTVGFLHSPDGSEVMPGHGGQLITITSLIVHPDCSVDFRGVGDLPFRVLKTWMPRGLRGLQMAFVEVVEAAPTLAPLLETCRSDQDLTPFARVLEAAPRVLALLEDPQTAYTVFAPRRAALAAAGFDERSCVAEEDAERLVSRHVHLRELSGRSFYAGRHAMAMDGTALLFEIARWPRGGISVNGSPVERPDVPFLGGVLHGMGRVL